MPLFLKEHETDINFFLTRFKDSQAEFIDLLIDFLSNEEIQQLKEYVKYIDERNQYDTFGRIIT